MQSAWYKQLMNARDACVHVHICTTSNILCDLDMLANMSGAPPIRPE